MSTQTETSGQPKNQWTVCPSCGKLTVSKGCKLICPACRRVVEGCSG